MKSKSKINNNPVVYETGGGCRDAIWFTNFREGKIYGFKCRLPKVGDLLTCAMESGRTLVCIFTNVNPCPDPVDAFFAKVGALAYADEPEGIKSLRRAKKDTGGMHPRAHIKGDEPLDLFSR